MVSSVTVFSLFDNLRLPVRRHSKRVRRRIRYTGILVSIIVFSGTARARAN